LYYCKIYSKAWVGFPGSLLIPLPQFRNFFIRSQRCQRSESLRDLSGRDARDARDPKGQGIAEGKEGKERYNQAFGQPKQILPLRFRFSPRETAPNRIERFDSTRGNPPLPRDSGWGGATAMLPQSGSGILKGREGINPKYEAKIKFISKWNFLNF